MHGEENELAVEVDVEASGTGDSVYDLVLTVL